MNTAGFPESGHPLQIIGTGCAGSCGGLGQQHASLLANADLIIAGKPVAEYLPDSCRHKLLAPEFPLSRFAARLRQFMAEGKKIVCLADGDPLLYGLGSSLASYFSHAQLKIHTAPSAMQLACSRLLLPAHNVVPVSLHGRMDYAPLFSALLHRSTVCVFTDKANTPAVIARKIIDHGGKCITAHVCERLGGENESIASIPLEDCANRIFATPNLLVLQPENKLQTPGPGLDSRSLRGSYGSNLAIRGAVLEYLKLRNPDIVWDIGSGSGIVSLEMSGLAREVFAVEGSAARAMDIQCNRASTGALNINLVYGKAPHILSELPRPHKIFVGGGLSGSGAREILDACTRNLLPGGRLAASFILLESFQSALAYMQNTGWPLEGGEIMLHSLQPLGRGLHLHPCHPVFMLACQKPAE